MSKRKGWEFYGLLIYFILNVTHLLYTDHTDYLTFPDQNFVANCKVKWVLFIEY